MESGHQCQLIYTVNDLSVLYNLDPLLKKKNAFLVAQRVKHLPAMQETRVWSLGWEDPMEKEMATHPSILAWRISWMEQSGRLQSTELQRVGHNWATSQTLYVSS